MTALCRGKIAIIGWHEGLAGQLHALLESQGTPVDCFVNETEHPLDIRPVPRKAKVFSYPDHDTFKGLPLITSPQWPDMLVQRGVTAAYLAVSDPQWRARAYGKLKDRCEILSYIHPTAILLPEASHGRGCILLPGSVLGYRAELGDGVLLSTGAQVDHHSVVADFATLLPSATLCGNVYVGSKATVGAGATVIQRINLGEGSFVGAGSLVCKDVEAYSQVIGNPARFHRHLSRS